MKYPINHRVVRGLALAMTSLLIPSAAFAAPYATDVTNNAGTVSFRLNENADNVKIISSGGAVTNDLGAGLKGITVTNLGIGSGVIKVVVLRSAPAGYTQLSTDGFQDNGIYANKFEHPRGVVVNQNPDTASFGRIYVGSARQGTTTGIVRETFDGIYLLNSDNTVALDTGVSPRTANLPFSTGTETASPLRLSIGRDDNTLYICDLGDPSGGLWATDLDVSEGINALAGIGDLTAGSTTHGSIYAAVVEGTTANSDRKIYTVDEDLTPVRTVWRYDVNGSAYPFNEAGNNLGQPLINTIVDLVKGGSGDYLYATQNRADGTDAPSIRIFTEDGVSITNSLDASREYLQNPAAADLLRNTLALDISPDGKTLAVLQGTVSGRVLLVSLTNGVFNFAETNSFLIGTSSNNNRDIAYDAAGNIYIVSSAGEWLRIYSKGGATLATTGTDGTFTIGVPPLLVGASATVATANEQGPVNGQFTITRSGDTAGSLTVNYTINGTAEAGTDYAALSGSVTFLPGATSTNIPVTVADDSVAEFTETVILTIASSANYGITAGTATVSIIDNEPTAVSVVLAQTESRLLEGFAGAKVTFRAERKGLLGPAITANLGYSGATSRFTGPSSVAIGANVATATFNITPINDQINQGNQIGTALVLPGTGYVVGTTNSANATIVDDEFPTGTPLFADAFETNSSALWHVISVDGGADSAADFAYDYSQLHVPPAPGGSSTLGLRFRLNEISGLRNAISASPAGLDVSGVGDYRVKFNMWINYNGPMFNGGAGSTMHLNTGIGTNPDHANLASAIDSDGIWFSISGDGGSTFAAGDISAYAASMLLDDDSGVYAAGTGLPASGIRSTTHPFYALWGNVAAPAAQLAAYPNQTGLSGPGNMGISWHSVVITKATNAVTLVIDGVTIATVPADSVPLSTNIFVGFQDQFSGTLPDVTAMSFAIVDNLRVETYSAAPPATPNITSIQIVGGNVVINFTAGAADSSSAFKLQSSEFVAGPYTDTAAVITGGSGTFQATIGLNGATRFYKIKR